MKSSVEIVVYSGLQRLTYRNGRLTLEPTPTVGWSIHVLGYVDIIGTFAVRRKYNPVAAKLAYGILRRLHNVATERKVLSFLDKVNAEVRKLNLTYSIKSPPPWWDLPQKW